MALSEAQQTGLAHFANLSTVMKKRQAQVEELAQERRQVARDLRETGVVVADLAKAGDVGTQAIYKLLS